LICWGRRRGVARGVGRVYCCLHGNATGALMAKPPVKGPCVCHSLSGPARGIVAALLNWSVAQCASKASAPRLGVPGAAAALHTLPRSRS
jgi:hypothetical protein